ncbi:MAG: DUF255 domain-containing protein [Bacteroidetes bacterium]|nr:DUF255 domain-containing protein [Bacteroidota bacterium]
MKKFNILVLFIASGFALYGIWGFTQTHSSEKNPTQSQQIKWITFEEAIKLNQKQPKKFIIDVYTNWCSWCKVMDKNTFTNPVIIKHINEYFYAVKLNAEMKDTVRFNDVVFVNPNPEQRSSVHQLAAALLNNQLSYPTTVFLDEGVNMLSPVPGYLKPQDMEPILNFYGKNHHKTTKWEDFTKTFKSEIAP